ncbi:MAG TPA: protein kinase [Candidatus Limnocylindrales bacterium]|nr:protein kinase [Candidatus Limnocylindrales bacterium]
MGETVLFGRYRLLEPAGSGGSAQVWRALDTETGDEVAVKRLHPLVVADDHARHRLEREFRSLRSLDEPHIVRVRELRIEDDEAALVLDYVAGPSLADRLTTGMRFEPAEAVGIVRDVAAALAAAHSAGIVHRDVTPGNILLAPGDGARLTDFGIAQAGIDGTAATAVTAAGQLVGTLRYLAPEQLRGEPATPASDLHALAAVTYEMLAGRPAYPATTPVGLVEAQARGPARIEGIPLALDEAVRRGLAPDPADRHPDVTAFADELVAALEDAHTELMPLPLMAGAVGGAAVGGAGVGGSSGAVAGSMWAPVPDAQPAPDAQPVEPVRPVGPVAPGRRTLPAPLAALLVLIVGAIALAAIGPFNGGASTGTQPAVAPIVTPDPTPEATAEPTPEPTAEPKNDKGKGNDNGKGNGKGNDKDDDKDD